MTERLFFRDGYRTEFEARILERREHEGRPAVVLDKTCFYPESGGQPWDTGTLSGAPVVQVVEEGESILHVLADESGPGPALETGAAVSGRIDWPRRFDHMQQHTGQHILSAAFEEVCEGETVGFHLGEASCTVDIDRAPLSDEQIAAVERLSNQIVFEDREVIAGFVDRDELASMPLRKMPVVEGPVRIVQVAGFDWSPCGGTHVSHTGQIGPIKVSRVERRKKTLRIYFLCGWRALADIAHKQQVVGELTAHLTTSEDELLSSVERLEVEGKRLRRALSEAQMALLEHEVVQWREGALSISGLRTVSMVFADRDVNVVREAARRLTAASGFVALLAVSEPRPQLVFASSEDVAADMGQLMGAACGVIGGKGGGRPHLAQGGAPAGAPLAEALEEAKRLLELEGTRSQ